MIKPICAANWKLHKTPAEAEEFLQIFLKSTSNEDQKHFLFFPPAIDLYVCSQHLGTTSVGWGAQNIYFENSGAFTGENSPELTKSIGATHALIGHSERRNIFGESDELVAKKVKSAQDNGLVPVLCVGELEAEREAGKTNDVLTTQISVGLSHTDKSKSVVIAYEPVWAIGTGKVATPELAQEAHAHIRGLLKSQLGVDISQQTPILYGGSVKPENAKELATQSDIDGFLVGGASLKVESFLGIYKNAQGAL